MMFLLKLSIWIFFNKVAVNKEYRQSVLNSENIVFFGSVIQKFQRLKIMTMAIVYVKIQSFRMTVISFDLIH